MFLFNISYSNDNQHLAKAIGDLCGGQLPGQPPAGTNPSASLRLSKCNSRESENNFFLKIIFELFD